MTNQKVNMGARLGKAARYNNVCIRLNDEELAKLKAEAKRLGCSHTWLSRSWVSEKLIKLPAPDGPLPSANAPAKQHKPKRVGSVIVDSVPDHPIEEHLNHMRHASPMNE